MNTFKMFIITIIAVFLISFTTFLLQRNNSKQTSVSENYQTSKKTAQFFANGCPMHDDQDWIVGKAIGCKRSPDGSLIGKFIFNSYYDPERYYELFIMTGDGSKEWKVFSGDFRTLGWRWEKDKVIKIDWNCGSGCMASKNFETNTYISIADYKTDGGMSEKSGWKVKFVKPF